MPETPETGTPEPQQQRSLPTPFLSKTYQIVDDPGVDDVVSWNEDGTTFIVWRTAEFARDLLPKYFKHNNFSSFVRQLNTYGFRKVVPDRWEFANDCFRRGEKRLLCDIHRRKITLPVSGSAPSPVTIATMAAIPVAVPVIASPTCSAEEQVLSSNSSPEMPPAPVAPVPPRGMPGSYLMEENERLRRENSRLAEELGQMKGLCNNIMALMSKYSAGQRAPEEAPAMPVSTELELMPSGRGSEEAEGPVKDDTEARLFGVAIGVKRARDEATVVKSEPELDDPADGAQSWVLYRARPNQAGKE